MTIEKLDSLKEESAKKIESYSAQLPQLEEELNKANKEYKDALALGDADGVIKKAQEIGNLESKIKAVKDIISASNIYGYSADDVAEGFNSEAKAYNDKIEADLKKYNKHKEELFEELLSLTMRQSAILHTKDEFIKRLPDSSKNYRFEKIDYIDSSNGEIDFFADVIPKINDYQFRSGMMVVLRQKIHSPKIK